MSVRAARQSSQPDCSARCGIVCPQTACHISNPQSREQPNAGCGSQVLWWDGLGKLADVLGGGEAGELLTILSDKGVHCRTDVYEIQLAVAAEAAGLAA